MSGERAADGSRIEAAEAGVHAETAEAAQGLAPEEHVTAVEVATADRPVAVPFAHHHPPDPNAGVVRGRVGRGATSAAVAAAAVTIAAIVLLALAVGGGR